MTANTTEAEILKACHKMDGTVGMRGHKDDPLFVEKHPDFICQIVQLDSLLAPWIDDEGYQRGFWNADSVHNPQVILFHGRTWEEVAQRMSL